MATAEILPPGVTASEHILGLAAKRNEHLALADAVSGFMISYRSFAATVRAAAAGLTRRGMRPGDAAGVYVAGPAAFALACHAIRTAGGVPSPMGPAECRKAVGARLAAGDCRMLITDAALVCAAREVIEYSRVRQLICFAEASGSTRFDALLHAGTMDPVVRAHDDLALLAWTSAPDGSPRRLPVTHRALGAQLRRLGSQAKLAVSDVVIAPPPCGDGRGYAALLDSTLAVGATVVSAPGTGAADLLAAARSHRGTVALVPPGTELAGCSLRRIAVRP